MEIEKEKEMAVCVRNACKSYGKKEVLNKLNMSVEKGTIYGLLGSSGCGKTTLLTCIVGARKLQSGDLCVLGGYPGSSDSAVPGCALGYMPQEIALIDELTVRGAIYYFGRIYEVEERDINERYEKLAKLLDLPPQHRYVKNCSGGQQRRISLAAALVGNPQLLILDEPTVGLDPIIREDIWNYFIELVEKQRVTVIITTHYIEETRQAHKIGLMRQGVLLSEESPDSLLQRYETDSLEEVFLLLSQKQTDGKLLEVEELQSLGETYRLPSIASSTNTIDQKYLNVSQDPLTTTTNKHKTSSNGFKLNYKRMQALIRKNWNQVIKNPSGISFMILFPFVQIFLFFLTVGNDVRDIKVAVVNHEDNYGTCKSYNKSASAIAHHLNQCSFQQLGCRYIEILNDPMIDLVPHNDTLEAIEGTMHGKFAGVIYIPCNFSTSLEERLSNGPIYTDENTLNTSQIQVWLDISERQIGTSVKYKLINKMIELQKSVFEDCNYEIKYGEVPLAFKEAVYGHNDDTMRVFVVPGILLTVMFFLGGTNTTPTIIADRLGGMWERSIIAGVSSLEMILTHFVVQFLIIAVQTIIVIVITFAVFQTEYLGSFVLIVVLVLLQGICGTMYGFLISVCAPDFSVAHFATSGSFHPMIMLCGIIWPIEGMPIGLRYISKCLPFTIPIISLRNVISKGWGVLHPEVANGLGIEIAWIIILLTASVLLLNKRK